MTRIKSVVNNFLDSQWLEGLKRECRGHVDHRLHFKTIRFVRSWISM